MTADGELEALFAQYESRFPFKVLYVEDDVKSAERVKSLFEGEPIEFMIAPGPEDADELIKEEDLDLVITDLRLGEQDTTGEAWIKKNFSRLKDAKKVILTGYATEIQDRPALRKAGVTIISKGEPEEDALWEKMRSAPREKAVRILKNSVDDVARLQVEPREPEGLGIVLEGPIKKLFVKWAEGFEDRESNVLSLGYRSYSINELIAEVENETEVGSTMIGMFIEDLEDLL